MGIGPVIPGTAFQLLRIPAVYVQKSCLTVSDRHLFIHSCRKKMPVHPGDLLFRNQCTGYVHQTNHVALIDIPVQRFSVYQHLPVHPVYHVYADTVVRNLYPDYPPAKFRILHQKLYRKPLCIYLSHHGHDLQFISHSRKKMIFSGKQQFYQNTVLQQISAFLLFDNILHTIPSCFCCSAVFPSDSHVRMPDPATAAEADFPPPEALKSDAPLSEQGH